MGFDNIVAGHGIGIALTGMTVVFAGLALVSTYIAVLPRLFAWTRRAWRTRGHATATAASAPVSVADADLLAAIGYVLQAERERHQSLDHQRITLLHDDQQQVWTAIGKMRTLATRR